MPSTKRVNNNYTLICNDGAGTFTVTGNLVTQVSNTLPTLGNATMSFQLVSDTELSIVVKGTDGITRTGNITLS